MLVGIECANCHALNVADISPELGINDRNMAFIRDIQVRNVETLEHFYSRYSAFIIDLVEHVEFPVHKDALIIRISQALHCSKALAYEIFEKIKLDLGLYEQQGMVYET